MKRIIEKKETMITVIILSIIVTLVTCYGIWGNLYSSETEENVIKGIGQDYGTLFFILPIFIISFLSARKGRLIGLILYLASTVYFFYTYLLYLIAGEVNSMFLGMVTVVALSLYLIIFTVTDINRNRVINLAQLPYRKLTISILLICTGLFYLLWLKKIIPHSISPEGNITSLTKAVHILDLGFLLPGILISAILAIKKKPMAKIFAPVSLAIFSLMSFVLFIMKLYARQNGLIEDFWKGLIYLTIFIITTTVLLFIFRKLKKVNIS